MKVTNFAANGIPVALGGWSSGTLSLNSNVDIIGGGPAALNFVQRITSNGSNTLLNPIVNFAAGSNIALSAASNTITITGTAGGGGGAVISAGSNSTRVSEDSAAGASSTLWSPFDHRHDGIGTITSSASNTMQRGTWNVRPGAGIALSLTDTDGDGEFDTTTIVATGSAGGGGAAYTGVGSTERALVDPTGLSWSWVNQGSATITAYTRSLVLHDPANTADSWRIRVKSVPTKPYSVIAHVKHSGLAANYTGIFVGWLQTSTNNFAGFNQYVTGGAQEVASAKSATNYLVTVNYVVSTGSVGYWQWVAVCDDATNRRIWVSRDGRDWLLFHSVATNDFLTPDRVMFGVESRNAGGWDAAIVVDSWEETASSTP